MPVKFSCGSKSQKRIVQSKKKETWRASLFLCAKIRRDQLAANPAPQTRCVFYVMKLYHRKGYLSSAI
nr:MAG TPA: hypothetical protein [Caudoviricetes sp.]